MVTELRARAGDCLLDVEPPRPSSPGSRLSPPGLGLRGAELEQSTADSTVPPSRVVETEAALTVARTRSAALAGAADEQLAQVDGAREVPPSVAERAPALRALVEAAGSRCG